MTGFRKWTAALGVGLAVVAIMAVAFPAAAATTTPDVAAHRGGGYGVSNTALAEALGITTTELATAQENAQKAAIEQAVEEGLITQAQADALLARGGTYGFRGHGGFFGSDTIDYDALLAEELNITVEKLQEARTTAYDANQAVADGVITQAQADAILAQSSGFKMFRMPGFGGRGGHGGMRFFGTPNSDSDSTTNSRFSGGFGTYYPGL